MALRCAKTGHCPLQYMSRARARPMPASRLLRAQEACERQSRRRETQRDDEEVHGDARDEGDKVGRPLVLLLLKLPAALEPLALGRPDLPPRLGRVPHDAALRVGDEARERDGERVGVGDGREREEGVAL